jgi:hypothetical protein
MAMVGRLPSQLVMKPQASLPAASADEDQRQCESRGSDGCAFSDQQERQAHEKSRRARRVGDGRTAREYETRSACAQKRPHRAGRGQCPDTPVAPPAAGGGQNGNHRSRREARESKQRVGRPPRHDQQQAGCYRWRQDFADVARESIRSERAPLNVRVTSAEAIGCCVAAPIPPRSRIDCRHCPVLDVLSNS